MPASSIRGHAGPPREGVPSDTEPLVAATAQVVGGPLGRHARIRTKRWGGRGPRRRLQVLPSRPIAGVAAFFAAALVGLGVVQKGYCFSHGWGGAEVFWRACYSDLPRLYVTSPMIDGSLPYGSGQGGFNQPVGTGVVLWLLSHVVPVGSRHDTWFVGIWAVTAALLAAALAAIVAVTLRRDPWRAAQVALCPLLVTTVLIAPDLLGVVLIAAGLLLWARERPMWAGLALGAAMTTRTSAVLVIIVLALVAARAGVIRSVARTAGVALLTWLGALLLVAVWGGTSVLSPYRAWLGGGAEFGAPVYLADLMGFEVPLGALTALAIAGWIVALLAGAMVTFVPAHRPKVAEVLVVVFVVAMLTGKAIPVQATLVLAPLLALAGVRWRDVLVWWSAELAYFVAVWLYLGGQDDPPRALPAGWYALFLLLRCAALAYLAYVASRAAFGRSAAPDEADELLTMPEDPDGEGDEADEGDDSARRRALAARADPDDVAGPAAGRPDALVVTFG